MQFAAIDVFGQFLNVSVAGRRQRAAAVIVAAALGVAGCATGPMGRLSKDSPLEAKVAAVTKRGQERWDLLLKGDVKASYAYLSPGSRAVTPLERYQARTNPASLRAIKVQSAACEAEVCRVSYVLTFDHRLMKGVETPLEETWVIEDGQAWFVYRE